MLFILWLLLAFIVNHSTSYTIAALASWTEYWLGIGLMGKWKLSWMVVMIGLGLVLAGQGLRTMAMWECGKNFSHRIAFDKSKEHVLITSGIYHYLRHPSYCGWFYWSIGTQVLLGNPLCTLLYTYTAWTFFQGRIDYEERLLVQFFGSSYAQYCGRSSIGIPFITSPIAITSITSNNSNDTTTGGNNEQTDTDHDHDHSS